MIPDPPQCAGLCIQIIYRHVEKSLNLRGVEIHRDDVVTPSGLQHIGDKLRRDWRSALVLLVLTRIGEVWDDGCDAAGAGRLAGVDHDEKLHEPVVDIARQGGLKDEHYKDTLVV